MKRLLTSSCLPIEPVVAEAEAVAVVAVAVAVARRLLRMLRSL